jgi:hypothetical protein
MLLLKSQDTGLTAGLDALQVMIEALVPGSVGIAIQTSDKKRATQTFTVVRFMN